MSISSNAVLDGDIERVPGFVAVIGGAIFLAMAAIALNVFTHPLETDLSEVAEVISGP